MEGKRRVNPSIERQREQTESLNINSFVSGFVSAQELLLLLCRLQQPSKQAVTCTVVPFSFYYNLCVCVCVCACVRVRVCVAIHCACCAKLV